MCAVSLCLLLQVCDSVPAGVWFCLCVLSVCAYCYRCVVLSVCCQFVLVATGLWFRASRCLVLSLCAVSLCLLHACGSVTTGKHVTVTLPINQPTPIPLLCVHSRLLARPADWQVHYCNRPIQWQHVMKPGEYSDGIRSCNSLEGHGVYRSVTRSPNLMSRLTGVQIKTDKKGLNSRTLELLENRGGHPGLPVPNSPYGLCGCKATLNLKVLKKELF